jgi:hypothetical protein
LGEAKGLIVALDCVEIDGLAPVEDLIAAQDRADPVAAHAHQAHPESAEAEQASRCHRGCGA